MKNIKYQLISTSGNPTAIVRGKFLLTKKQKITQKIFADNALVEQIGYIYRDNKNKIFKFEMMGNEFSGNGCRAAAFSILGMKQGRIKFKSSGSNKIINASIGKDLTSSISIPYLYSERKIIRSQFGFMLKMFGSYLIVVDGNKDMTIVKTIISRLSKKADAVGIMFMKKTEKDRVELNPFFYVKRTQTLINETACGSGSVAVAIYLSYKNKKSMKNLEIRQPSGQAIIVKTKYFLGKVSQIKISGPTKFLGNYKIQM